MKNSKEYTMICIYYCRYHVFLHEMRTVIAPPTYMLTRNIPTQIKIPKRKYSHVQKLPPCKILHENSPHEKSPHQQTLTKIVFLDDIRLVWLHCTNHASLRALVYSYTERTLFYR